MTRREFLRSLAGGAVALAAGCIGVPTASAAEEGEGMVLIPAGPAVLGTSEAQAERTAREYGFHPSWLAGEVPRRRVEAAAFRIDRCPVTNAQYAEFCRATGYAPRNHWPGGQPDAWKLDHPVVCVNWMDAQAYTKWAGKRLPTEAEWEKAARGPDGLLYPWGEEFDAGACQWNRERTAAGPGTAAVTAHPQGASPYGVVDMVGNAAEWCADAPEPGACFIKGGAWITETPLSLRPAGRNMSGFSNNAANFYGFRCAMDA